MNKVLVSAFVLLTGIQLIAAEKCRVISFGSSDYSDLSPFTSNKTSNLVYSNYNGQMCTRARPKGGCLEAIYPNGQPQYLGVKGITSQQYTLLFWFVANPAPTGDTLFSFGTQNQPDAGGKFVIKPEYTSNGARISGDWGVAPANIDDGFFIAKLGVKSALGHMAIIVDGVTVSLVANGQLYKNKLTLQNAGFMPYLFRVIGFYDRLVYVNRALNLLDIMRLRVTEDENQICNVTSSVEDTIQVQRAGQCGGGLQWDLYNTIGDIPPYTSLRNSQYSTVFLTGSTCPGGGGCLSVPDYTVSNQPTVWVPSIHTPVSFTVSYKLYLLPGSAGKQGPFFSFSSLSDNSLTNGLQKPFADLNYYQVTTIQMFDLNLKDDYSSRYAPRVSNAFSSLPPPGQTFQVTWVFRNNSATLYVNGKLSSMDAIERFSGVDYFIPFLMMGNYNFFTYLPYDITSAEAMDLYTKSFSSFCSGLAIPP